MMKTALLSSRPIQHAESVGTLSWGIDEMSSSDWDLNLCVSIFRSFASQVQTLVESLRLPRDQLHLEVSWYGHQCGLELVIVHVVSVRWFLLAGDYLVAADQPNKSGV